MAEINRTEDPDKRDELIQSHMANMQEIMKIMQDMHGGKSMTGQGMVMPGGKMMGGQQGDRMATPQGGMMEQGMGMQGGKMMGGQQAGMMEMMNRQKMMEQRMDLMQMMLDQMMQDQAASEKTRMYRKWRYDRYKEK